MEDNIFLKNKRKLTLKDYMNFNGSDRGNLGDSIPVSVYRLLEYSMREELREELGAQEQIRIFRAAGKRAGEFFAQEMLNLDLEPNEFIAMLQERLEEMRIGVMRIESVDEETEQIMLTISEDADCSGMPLLDETVCNYDEGFLSGVLSSYYKKRYQAIEIDCWATGARVCRFRAEPTAEE